MSCCISFFFLFFFTKIASEANNTDGNVIHARTQRIVMPRECVMKRAEKRFSTSDSAAHDEMQKPIRANNVKLTCCFSFIFTF